MANLFLVTGSVAEVTTDKYGVTVIVRVQGGKEPQPVKVKAGDRAKCYDDLCRLRRGERVEIQGFVSGREHKGSVYTDLVAVFLRVVDEEPRGREAPRDERRDNYSDGRDSGRRGDGGRRDEAKQNDNDDVPF